MPIYAYRCESCGFARDVLQKISDAPLTTCPTCGQEQFRKQLTAAGFQLKGSGWYATDFKGGNAAAKPADKPAADTPTTSSGSSSGSDAGSSAAPAATPAPATTTSGSCGAGCSCH